MAQIRHSETEWINIIQSCKSSGFSDSEWCHLNNIPISTFYRKLSILRGKACADDRAKPVVRDEQEVVEVNLHHEQPLPEVTSQVNNDVALRVTINGVTNDSLNIATKTTIESTLQSLRFLC